MAVTRLKRKDRRNKNTAHQEVAFLKRATNIELGSRSAQPKNDQLAKNNAVLATLAKIVFRNFFLKI
ncbi:spore protein [Pedobacter sp. P26]